MWREVVGPQVALSGVAQFPPQPFCPAHLSQQLSRSLSLTLGLYLVSLHPTSLGLVYCYFLSVRDFLFAPLSSSSSPPLTLSGPIFASGQNLRPH